MQPFLLPEPCIAPEKARRHRRRRRGPKHEKGGNIVAGRAQVNTDRELTFGDRVRCRALSVAVLPFMATRETLLAKFTPDRFLLMRLAGVFDDPAKADVAPFSSASEKFSCRGMGDVMAESGRVIRCSRRTQAVVKILPLLFYLQQKICARLVMGKVRFPMLRVGIISAGYRAHV